MIRNIKKKKNNSSVYLDYAAATPIDPRVWKEFQRVSLKHFANPDGLSSLSVQARKELERARWRIAATLHCLPDEIIFTSGATEANNLAIAGFLKKIEREKQLSKTHVIVSGIEHSSVLESLREFEKKGLKLSFLPVDENGIVFLVQLKKLLRPETVMIAVMAANNEIGTVQPIAEISKIVRAQKKQIKKKTGKNHHKELHLPVIFSDAGQLPLYGEFDLRKFPADLVTIDSQKLYAPKGTGVLIKRRKIALEPIIVGGGQEKGFRSGTPNVAGAAAFAEALELATLEQKKESKRLKELQNYFFSKLTKEIKVPFVINGSLADRLPNNINVSFLGCDGEFLALALDSLGIACSTKSACLEGAADQKESAIGSYVVEQLGADTERIAGTIRFSLGRFSAKNDIDKTVAALKQALQFVR